MPLTVDFEHAIAAASVTATSPDKLCPAVPSAEVTFTVATSHAADSLSAALLDATTQEPVPDVTCTAAATDGSGGLNWAVSCPGAPVGGSYVLALVATSARGGLRADPSPPGGRASRGGAGAFPLLCLCPLGALGARPPTVDEI